MVESEQDMSSRSDRPTRHLVRRLGRLAGRLVLLALAACVLTAVVTVVVLPRAVHGTAMTVLTGSMAPAIPVGSVVVVRPVDARTLRVGDVATYQAEPGKASYITHRIAKIVDRKDGLSFVFKGDANRGEDLDPVPAKAIRGEVWFHVPYLGAFRDAIHGKGGITLLGILALGGYAVSQISGGLRSRKPNPKQVSANGVIGPPWPLVRAQFLTYGLVDQVAELAKRLGGTVIHQDVRGFALLVGAAPTELDAVINLLRSAGASRVDLVSLSSDADPLDVPPLELQPSRSELTHVSAH